MWTKFTFFSNLRNFCFLYNSEISVSYQDLNWSFLARICLLISKKETINCLENFATFFPSILSVVKKWKLLHFLFSHYTHIHRNHHQKKGGNTGVRTVQPPQVTLARVVRPHRPILMVHTSNIWKVRPLHIYITTTTHRQVKIFYRLGHRQVSRVCLYRLLIQESLYLW